MMQTANKLKIHSFINWKQTGNSIGRRSLQAKKCKALQTAKKMFQKNSQITVPEKMGAFGLVKNFSN